MKWAQRWSVNDDGEMTMDDSGSWVENAYYEYLKADYAVLKADAQLVVKHLGEACADNLRLNAELTDRKDEADRLKAEVEAYKPASDEVASAFLALPAPHNQVGRVVEGIESLKAEVERLRKAGDAMELTLQADFNGCPYEPLIVSQAIHYWRTAKDSQPHA